MADLPQPGEVWICTEPRYGPKNWESIDVQGPFIVTYLSNGRVGYTQASNGPEARQSWVVVSATWNWHEHMTRLWPPVPSWDELEREGKAPVRG